jgi:hypothetical protein
MKHAPTFFCAVLLGILWLPGCKPAPPAPVKGGVSVALDYPVLLIGQATVDVRDSEEQLISVSVSSGLNLLERLVVDSKGRMFDVTRSTLVAGSTPSWLDMGTSPRAHYVELRERRNCSWAAIQSAVLDQVRSPRSVWENNPKAVQRVKAVRNVEELIALSRETWTWAE